MSKYKVTVVAREYWYRDYEIEASSEEEAQDEATDLMSREGFKSSPSDDGEVEAISCEEIEEKSENDNTLKDGMKDLERRREQELNGYIERIHTRHLQRQKVQEQLDEAVEYLRQAKREFAPHTTNSLVDAFLNRLDKSKEANNE